ncbi:cytochrome C assembly family protein [Bacillus horti]|uniref:HemX protein n=1 Tax=Caldalkalibacillus horti TaxID=77523 RepID=A0ABT9VTL5_9BACI|nr:cytochrome c biogenesis protein [Bacillus horti]MDQ0164323.1 HemX protein [Bacillus horti]
MHIQSILYDLIIVIYACSVLFYFFDFLQNNRKANKIAFWLLSIVWISQTIYVSQVFLQEALPFWSKFDTLFLFSWLLITLSLLVNIFFRMDIFLFFTNVVGFSIMAMSMFLESRNISEELATHFTSGWLVIHITMAFLSYAAFTLSAIFSVIYLYQHRLLKQKKWNNQMKRGPSLAQLDKASFFLNIAAVPLLFLSLILGSIWAFHTLEGAEWIFDSKVILSVFVLLMYTIYLFQRVVRGWTGKRITELNVICFFILVVNYVLSNLFSTFHLWT